MTRQAPTATLAPNQPSPTPTPTLAPGQPSATPTRTPTRTPTLTPTSTGTLAAALPPCYSATQRPAPAGWAFNKVCLYSWGDGSWTLYGEITNNSGSNQSLVDIEARFYNGAGAELGIGYGGADPEVIPNGARLPFSVDLDSPSPPAQYGFNIDIGLAGGATPTILSATNVQLVASDADVYLTGQVTATGLQPDSDVELMAAFYSADGKVVGRGYTYFFYPDDFDSQGMVSFDIPADGLTEFITTYALVAYGY
jgi:hypothetical protein